MTRQNSLAACVALILGAALGFYVARGSRVAPSTENPAPTARPLAGSAAGMAPLATDQFKRMGDKQAQPLLAQLKSTPDDPQLLAKVGHIYSATHNFKDAVTYFKRSVETKDDPVVRVELGRAYYYSGDPDNALAEFQMVLKSDPNNANALFNVGMIKWQSKSDADGAIAAWQKLLNSNPRHPRRAEIEQLIAQVKQQRSAGPLTKAHNPN